MTIRFLFLPLWPMLLAFSLLVSSVAAEVAPSNEAGELLETIEPVEATGESLAQWYERLVATPALIPSDCRADPERHPTAQEYMHLESRLAEAVRASITDAKALRAIEEQAADRALEFAYNRSLRESVSVPREEIERVFEAERERFRRPAVAQFNFFFLPAAGDGEANAEEEAPPEALVRLAEMAAKGTEIGALRLEAMRLAVAFSDQTTRGVEGSLTPLVEQAIFSAEPGSFTDITRTENGWHLFEVRSVRPGSEPDLESAAPQIESRLANERTGELRVRIREAMRGTEEGRALANDAEGEELDGLLERAFAQRLFADRGEDIARIAEVITNNAIIELWANELMQGLEFTEEELRAEFERNPERYRSREEFSVLEAQVPLPRAEDFASPMQAQGVRVELRRRLIELTDRLHEEGRTLADLDEGEAGIPIRILDRGTRHQGPRGAMLDRAVANLEEGAFSPPIVGREYFHLFQLTEKHPPREVPFEEVRERVEQLLRADTFERRYAEAACGAMESAGEAPAPQTE